jgi:hypothetical protein
MAAEIRDFTRDFLNFGSGPESMRYLYSSDLTLPAQTREEGNRRGILQDHVRVEYTSPVTFNRVFRLRREIFFPAPFQVGDLQQQIVEKYGEPTQIGATRPKAEVWELLILYVYKGGELVSALSTSNFDSCIKETEERGLNAIYGNKFCDAVFYVRFTGPSSGQATGALFGMFDFKRVKDTGPVNDEALKAIRLKQEEHEQPVPMKL